MKLNGTKVIAIDIDNTILENDSSLLYYLLNKRPGRVSFGRDAAIKLDCSKAYKMSALNKVLKLLNPKKFYFIEGAKPAIDKLSQENTLILLSSRPYFMNSIKYLTAENVKMMEARIDFVFVNCGDKKKFCEDFGVDYFVDDVFKQCLEVSKNKNVKVICFDKKLKNQKGENVVCLNDWNSIFQYINDHIKYFDKIKKNGDNLFLNYGIYNKFRESKKTSLYERVFDWEKFVSVTKPKVNRFKFEKNLEK